MKLASSSYYYQPGTNYKEREQSDAELRDHIERLHREFPRYGYQRLSRQLRREGIKVNDKKIRRLQRTYGFFRSVGRVLGSPPLILVMATRSIRIS